ncbi:site-2 protease family protein [Candidatus Bathyarchaeota archaeon]|nr:site-2 protease family protein [Candidatus Bathyarchaeota archaeon]
MNEHSSLSASEFDRIQRLVDEQFDVEEALIEHAFPTFYIRMKPDSKRAFTKLRKNLAPIGFMPVLRKSDGRCVLKIAAKPVAKPSRSIINILLLLATIVSVFITGYFFSIGLVANAPNYELDPWVGAASFTIALLGILSVHEMAHKVAANHHGLKASMPYFIPGPPSFPGFAIGIGTFGAVIVQKETAPNRDALFDIGASGPIVGFILAVLFSAVGLAMSPVVPMTEPSTGGISSLLFSFLVRVTVPVPGPGLYLVYLHPVAWAGFIGLFVTFLNLLPTGMLDGGHALRSITNKDFTRTLFIGGSILALLLTGQWVMLAFILFLSTYKHPGPLDDVSRLSLSRKLTSIALISMFFLCLLLPQDIIWKVLQLF